MRVFVVSLTPAQRCSYADGQYGEGGVHREGECVEEPGRSCERADTPGMTENAERRCTLCACKCHLVQHRATTNESRVRRQAEESPCPMPPQQRPAFAQPPVAQGALLSPCQRTGRAACEGCLENMPVTLLTHSIEEFAICIGSATGARKCVKDVCVVRCEKSEAHTGREQKKGRII